VEDKGGQRPSSVCQQRWNHLQAGIGTVLLPNADLRNWDFLYKSAYSQEFKRVRYSPPVWWPGGSRKIEWSNRTSDAEAYATTKTLLPYVLAAVTYRKETKPSSRYPQYKTN
jgi:hypothetical protein